jgi:hypothetical protein
MALNELFRSLVEIEAEAEPLLDDELPGAELELELLLPELQAAISSAALRPAATAPAFFSEDTYVPRLICPGWPGEGRAAAVVSRLIQLRLRLPVWHSL